MSTKGIVGRSNVQNKRHMSGEATCSKHTTSNAESEPGIEIIPDMSDTKSAIEKKGVSAGVSGPEPDLFLDQLGLDVTGTIIVMIGRVWDVSVVSGRYLSTEFIVSDSKLVDFDAIEPADNKYLIDVAGYVTNVGKINHLKSGSKNLDFHLANHIGQSIRVTLWGNLREVLVEKKQNRLARAQLSSLRQSPKFATVYLSSTSSTMILDDAEILAIKALRDADRSIRASELTGHRAGSGVKLKNPYVPIDLTRPVQGTIENLLMWSRNRKNNVPSFLSSLVWYTVTLSFAITK
ncbi:replication protein A 70 kDa DNA-binding subunit C-like protein [Tanacetum coccineum]